MAQSVFYQHKKLMAKENKPTLQRAAQNTAESAFGSTPAMQPPSSFSTNDGDVSTRPALEPPFAQHASGASLSAGASVWATQKVTGLWTIDQDRNAWAHINNEGWRKINPASESGLMALNMLAASARQTNGDFHFRKESDNMIYEAYAW